MTKRNLRGATVVITGASSGIGQAAAYAFARCGSNLVLAARGQAALSQVAADCERLGVVALAVPTDVTDYEAVRALARAAHDRFGRIDVWINNAGVGAIGEFTETPMESHEQVIRTNLLGYMHGAHAALPYFQGQQSGVLINTNSEGGWVPAPRAVAYTASKFGLRGFSEALRGELVPFPEISVCDVFPAFIDTPALHHAANYTGREIKPLPPLYDPHRVAEAMVSLARSPRNAVTVGQSATVARIGHFFFPGALRWGMERLTGMYLARAKPVAKSHGNLFQPPTDEPGIYGGWRRSSTHGNRAPWGAALAAGVAAGLYLTWRRSACRE